MMIKLKKQYITERFCIYFQRDFKTAGGLSKHIYKLHEKTYAYYNLLNLEENDDQPTDG